jgi:hypothetical protein
MARIGLVVALLQAGILRNRRSVHQPNIHARIDQPVDQPVPVVGRLDRERFEGGEIGGECLQHPLKVIRQSSLEDHSVLFVDDGQDPIVGMKIDRWLKCHCRLPLLLDMSPLGSERWTVLSAVGRRRDESSGLVLTYPLFRPGYKTKIAVQCRPSFGVSASMQVRVRPGSDTWQYRPIGRALTTARSCSRSRSTNRSGDRFPPQ